jgi:hypothetical protein
LRQPKRAKQVALFPAEEEGQEDLRAVRTLVQARAHARDDHKSSLIDLTDFDSDTEDEESE